MMITYNYIAHVYTVHISLPERSKLINNDQLLIRYKSKFTLKLGIKVPKREIMTNKFDRLRDQKVWWEDIQYVQ